MSVSVRYIVHDVDAAIDFYTGHLGFEVDIQTAPGFEKLYLGRLAAAADPPCCGRLGPGNSGRFGVGSQKVEQLPN